MSTVDDLHKRWSRDPDYRKAFDELGAEFELARSVTEARIGDRLRASLGHPRRTRRGTKGHEAGLMRPEGVGTAALARLGKALGRRVRYSLWEGIRI